MKNPSIYHPLRDYADFYSPKQVIAGEEVMLEKLREVVKRYYLNTSDFEFFHVQKGLPQKQSEDLQVAASVLRFLGVNNTKTKIKALAFKGIETAKQLAGLVQKAFDYAGYGLKKIKTGEWISVKQLLAKAKAFFKSKFDVSGLVHKNKQNEHASKAWRKDVRDILLGFYADPDKKLLESQVFEEYNKVVLGKRNLVNPHTGEMINNTARQLPIIKSRTTIWNFFQNEWIQRISSKLRNGNKYYNDHYRPYVRREKPKYSLSFVSSDGQRVPFCLREEGVNTYKRPDCYLLFDAKTGYIISWAMGLKENKALMKEAFGNMLMNLEGTCPMEIQLDNFGKHYQKELEQIFPHVSFCQPLHPQSKYAENFIGQFENHHCRKVEGWTGGNITSKNRKGAYRPNPDGERTCYSITEMKALYARLISDYNNAITNSNKGKSRKEAFLNNINPGCKKIENTVLASLFGRSTFSSINRGAVEIQVNGEKYEFTIDNVGAVGAKQKNGKSVKVKYLPYMLNDRIWLYNYDKYDKHNTGQDELLSEAISVHNRKPQSAKAEQNEADLKKLGKMLKWGSDTEVQDDQDAAENIPTLMSEADYEAVLASGYTEKDLMREADEKATELISEALKAPAKKKQRGKTKAAKKLKAARYGAKIK